MAWWDDSLYQLMQRTPANPARGSTALHHHSALLGVPSGRPLHWESLATASTTLQFAALALLALLACSLLPLLLRLLFFSLSRVVRQPVAALFRGDTGNMAMFPVSTNSCAAN